MGLGGRALTIEFGEVRTPAAVERLASLGEAPPQRIVDLAIHAANGLPLVEDLAQPVARDLPLGGFGGDLLGFGRQRLFALGLLVPGAVLLLLGMCGGLVGVLDNGLQAGGEPIDITDDGRGRQCFGKRGGGGLGLTGVGAGGEPGLQQRHLGGDIVEAAAEVGQALGGIAGLPRADNPLALDGLDPGGAVLVDPSPLAGVTHGGHHHRMRMRCRRAGSGLDGVWFRGFRFARPGPRTGTGDGGR